MQVRRNLNLKYKLRLSDLAMWNVGNTAENYNGVPVCLGCT